MAVGEGSSHKGSDVQPTERVGQSVATLRGAGSHGSAHRAKHAANNVRAIAKSCAHLRLGPLTSPARSRTCFGARQDREAGTREGATKMARRLPSTDAFGAVPRSPFQNRPY